MAEGGDPRPGADLDVLQHAVRADFDRIGQLDLALEDAADVDGHIAPMGQRTAYVDPCRVGQTHAGDQQLVGQITLVLAFQFGQLDLAVDAEHFPLAFGLRGAHRQAFGHRQRDDVGQVVLALGVVVLQFAQPVGQTGRRNGHDPVLTSRMAFCSGVASFSSTMLTMLPAALRTMRP
jgi:hypothetical protein